MYKLVLKNYEVNVQYFYLFLKLLIKLFMTLSFQLLVSPKNRFTFQLFVPSNLCGLKKWRLCLQF